MISGTFAALGVHPSLSTLLTNIGVSAPTNIQWKAIPTLISTNDHHFLAAQTGTGKTLAYLIPILHKFITAETPEKPKSLVVTFSRELVLQSEYVLEPFREKLALGTGSLYCGQKVEVWKEMLMKKPQVVYGTMERVEALRAKGELSFEGLRELVLDECDTLVDSGKTREIEKILTDARRVPNLRITLVSATFPRLLEAILDNYFTSTPAQPPSTPYLNRIIEEKAHFNLNHLNHEFILNNDRQPGSIFLKVLRDVYKGLNDKGCIVFCNSTASVGATLAIIEKDGFAAVGLHGEMSVKERIRNYKGFRSGEKKILVCTDLGSRGLDFPHVSHVIQSEFPKTISDYLHRAGRTGRCYREGTVITLYRKSDESTVSHIKNSFDTGVPLHITSSAFSYSLFSIENKQEVVHKKLTGPEKMQKVLQNLRSK